MTADQTQLTQATEKGDFEKLSTDAQAAWEQRLSKDQLLVAINTWEKAAKTETPNLSEAERTAKLAEIYETLSRAYYFLADSHLRLEGDEDEMSEKMMAQFEHGVTAAEKAIALRDPKFAATVSKDGSEWQNAVKSADTAALPALYWYSTNLGKWALLEGVATILARKDDIKATMDWASSNNDKYFHGAPHRYFGVYHTKVPLGGGAPTKAKASFEKSIAIAPNYLASKVLMASSYSVLVGDRALFETLLKEVVAANPEADPTIVPENKLEQTKAKRLLAQADDFFY